MELPAAIFLVSGDEGVLEWYDAAGVRKAAVAAHMGKSGDEHARIISALILHRNPDAEPLTQSALTSLAEIYDALNDHDSTIALANALRNPFDTIRNDRKDPSLVARIAGRLLDTVKKQESQIRQRSRQQAADKVAAGSARTRHRDQENLEKQPYIDALHGVLARATAALAPELPDLIDRCSKVADGDDEEAERLIEGQLSSGRLNTIKNFVLAWLRLERWFEAWPLRKSTDKLYPLEEKVLVRYIEYLENEDCGPAVPDATRAAISWISKKIGFSAVTVSTFVTTITERILEAKWKPIKEAQCPPLDVLASAEAIILDESEPFYCRVAMAWLCCLAWAALRGDDVTWMIPLSAEMLVTCLVAMAKRTKTTPRGLRVAIPNVFVGKAEWLPTAAKLFEESIADTTSYTRTGDAYTEEMNRDYLLDRIYVDRHGAWMIDKKVILKGKHMNDLYQQCLIKLGVPEADRKKLTIHGLKSIVPTLAAHDGKRNEDTMIACRWASTTMPTKYARNIGAVGVRMVKELTDHVRDNWNPMKQVPIPSAYRGRDRGYGPVRGHRDQLLHTADLPPLVQENLGSITDRQDDVDLPIEAIPLYYLISGHDWIRQLSNKKWVDSHSGHLPSLTDLSKLACTKDISGSSRYEIGRYLGEITRVAMVCGNCRRARPDVIQQLSAENAHIVPIEGVAKRILSASATPSAIAPSGKKRPRREVVPDGPITSVVATEAPPTVPPRWKPPLEALPAVVRSYPAAAQAIVIEEDDHEEEHEGSAIPAFMQGQAYPSYAFAPIPASARAAVAEEAIASADLTGEEQEAEDLLASQYAGTTIPEDEPTPDPMDLLSEGYDFYGSSPGSSQNSFR